MSKSGVDCANNTCRSYHEAQPLMLGFLFLKRTRQPYPQSVSNELVRSGSWWKYALKNGLRVVAQNTEGMVRMNNGFALGGFGCGGRR